MRRNICLLVLASVLMFTGRALAQEKFIDVREDMAASLTKVKESAAEGNWSVARENLNKAKDIWKDEVKGLILEDQGKGKRFQEYFDRINEIKTGLETVRQSLRRKKADAVKTAVNAVIWSISHQPRGFDVDPPRYTAWDWVFALTIGFGFIIFTIFFGLYLRRSFYRRYEKAGVKLEGAKEGKENK